MLHMLGDVLRLVRSPAGVRAAVGGVLLAAASITLAADPALRPIPARALAESVAPPRGIADLKALETTVRTVVAKVTPSVVSVSGGSGVVISREGYVLTVAHVNERAGRHVSVIFSDGRRARAVTLGNDFGIDAGMIKITDPGPWPYAEMINSVNVKPGQWCLTLGYPANFEHGKPPLTRIGRILYNRDTEIITDCTIMGGDSGAPLFNLDGKVIAIGTMCDVSLVHNIHVPMEGFARVWDRLAKGEDFDSLAPSEALLGIIQAEDAAEVRVGSLVPGSGAEQAGLKPGDVLLKFGDKDLRAYEDLPPLVHRRKPGDRVEILLRRGTETVKVQVTLGRNNEEEE